MTTGVSWPHCFSQGNQTRSHKNQSYGGMANSFVPQIPPRLPWSHWFYRIFIKSYATITSPLTTLLRNDYIKWSSEAQEAFELLKQAMTKAPVLALPDFSLPFVLETNASRLAIGAVLMQKYYPITFFSKPFCPCLQRASTYVRELHAITMVVRKWG